MPASCCPSPVLLCLLSLLASSVSYLGQASWWLVVLTPSGQLHLPDPDAHGSALATRMVVQTHLDYGKVRLCGSFALSSPPPWWGGPGGQLWQRLGAAHHGGRAADHAGASLPLRPAPGSCKGSGPRPRCSSRSGRPRCAAFLLITALLQGATRPYYGFSAICWKSAGYSGTPDRVSLGSGGGGGDRHVRRGQAPLQRFGAQTLFLVGALGCVVRWVLLGSSTDLAVLVLGQLLHGVTFCVSHLGAIRFMTRQLPAEQQIPTQALYAALGLA